MTRPQTSGAPVTQEDNLVSLFALASILLLARRTILAWVFVGAGLGLALAILPGASFQSKALFQPQSSQTQSSELALVASSFGFGSTSGGGAWGPALYVELLKTRTVLEPVVMDTLQLQGEKEPSLPVLKMLDDCPGPGAQLDCLVESLKKHFKVREVPEIGAVEVVVSTKSAAASQALAARLVESVNRFNLVQRKSQAAQERDFVQTQLELARADLDSVEEDLLKFIQHNRSFTGVPELQFEHDRLRREVESRQRVYSTLVNDLAEARIREVRDTPVITMLENPGIPSRPKPRHLVTKVVLGSILGFLLGVILVFAIHGWTVATAKSGSDAREFRRTLGVSLPWKAKGV